MAPVREGVNMLNNGLLRLTDNDPVFVWIAWLFPGWDQNNDG
jgi:hypothetical protein